MKIKALLSLALFSAALTGIPAQAAKIHEPMSLGELRVKIARLHVGKEACSKQHQEFLRQHLEYYRHEEKTLKEHEFKDLSKKLDHFSKTCKKDGFS